MSDLKKQDGDCAGEPAGGMMGLMAWLKKAGIPIKASPIVLKPGQTLVINANTGEISAVPQVPAGAQPMGECPCEDCRLDRSLVARQAIRLEFAELPIAEISAVRDAISLLAMWMENCRCTTQSMACEIDRLAFGLERLRRDVHAKNYQEPAK
jgi:hypothetical protein